MRFEEDPTYPGIAADFRRSYETLRAEPCELFLASHAGFFNMQDKRERLGSSDGNLFVDPAGYRAYVDRAEQRLAEAIRQERAQK